MRSTKIPSNLASFSTLASSIGEVERNSALRICPRPKAEPRAHFLKLYNGVANGLANVAGSRDQPNKEARAILERILSVSRIGARSSWRNSAATVSCSRRAASSLIFRSSTEFSRLLRRNRADLAKVE
jgi:hypothetical protein